MYHILTHEGCSMGMLMGLLGVTCSGLVSMTIGLPPDPSLIITAAAAAAAAAAAVVLLGDVLHVIELLSMPEQRV